MTHLLAELCLKGLPSVGNSFSTSAHTHKNLWGTASALLALHLSVLGVRCPTVGTCHFCQFSHWDSATLKCRNKETIKSNPTHDGGPWEAWVSITNNYLDTLVSKLTKWVCVSLNKEIYPPPPLLPFT
jgi:hypothetical protein